MIAVSPADLEQNHALLCEYRRACELLGYDPAKAQWAGVHEVSASQLPADQDHTVCYYPSYCLQRNQQNNFGWASYLVRSGC